MVPLEAFFSAGFLDLVIVDGPSMLIGAFEEVKYWMTVEAYPVSSTGGGTSFSTLRGFSPPISEVGKVGADGDMIAGTF